MPSSIERLQQMLSASLLNFGDGNFSFPDQGVKEMSKTLDKIHKVVGDRPATPGKERICSALRKLREHGAASLDGMEFYFVCWGLTESCGNLPKLIEDEPHFTDLLREIRLRKPTTLSWQGLLDSYFRYSPDNGDAGGRNWLLLRNWLIDDLPHLSTRTSSALRPHLTWLTVLQENRGLLGDDPCRPYAESALRGELTQIQRIKSALSIPESSWFWQKLILSQVDEATGWSDDAQFKSVLESLIAQLYPHVKLVDVGLAKLLSRYERCVDKPPHERLKLFAVEKWGSPQLRRQARWGLVEPRVKEMVCQWLALEDLEDFFGLLAADRAADQRRLRFWSQFIKQISFSHIVLGSDFWWSRDQDWASLREKKKGRISRLDGGGSNRNAFIMKIGGYYFIEFGEDGDACYGYAEGNEPFSLGKGNEPFSLGSGVLRYRKLKVKELCLFWGSHRGDWECRFMRGGTQWPGLQDLGLRPDRDRT